MSNYYTLENPIIWDWDVSREMPNINNFKPRTTTLWDPSLPMETIPPIHIFTYYEEETGRIKISKDWWKHYLAEYYTEFQLREHVSRISVRDRRYNILRSIPCKLNIHGIIQVTFYSPTRYFRQLHVYCTDETFITYVFTNITLKNMDALQTTYSYILR